MYVYTFFSYDATTLNKHTYLHQFVHILHFAFHTFFIHSNALRLGKVNRLKIFCIRSLLYQLVVKLGQ